MALKKKEFSLDAIIERILLSLALIIIMFDELFKFLSSEPIKICCISGNKSSIVECGINCFLEYVHNTLSSSTVYSLLFVWTNNLIPL